MFDALHTIIVPNPDPWPFPKHDWTMKELLIAGSEEHFATPDFSRTAQ